MTVQNMLQKKELRLKFDSQKGNILKWSDKFLNSQSVDDIPHLVKPLICKIRYINIECIYFFCLDEH